MRCLIPLLAALALTSTALAAELTIGAWDWTFPTAGVAQATAEIEVENRSADSSGVLALELQLRQGALGSGGYRLARIEGLPAVGGGKKVTHKITGSTFDLSRLPHGTYQVVAILEERRVDGEDIVKGILDSLLETNLSEGYRERHTVISTRTFTHPAAPTGGPGFPPPVEPTVPTSHADLAGSWDSTFGPVVLKVRQTWRVTGTFASGGLGQPRGQLAGEIVGDRMELDWSSGPTDRGRATWTVAPRATRLVGNWGRGQSTTNGSPDPTWTLSRPFAGVGADLSNLSGQWSSNFGDVVLDVRPIRQVTGTFGTTGPGQRPGTLQGTIDRDQMLLDWMVDANEFGKAAWTVTPGVGTPAGTILEGAKLLEGTTILEGTWGRGNQTTGGDPAGWTLSRP